MIAGHPALRLLARRKLVGVLRKQIRRMKSPSGALLALVGFSALALWIGSVTFNIALGELRRGSITPSIARFVGTAITFMSIVGALSFRGLYLPREEIELLFAAPVSRGDVIRYRLWTSLGKSLFGAFFFSLVVMGRVEVPLYGFVGGMLAMLTLPLLAQAVSLAAGDAENRWVARVPRGSLRVLNLLLLVFVLALVFWGTQRGSLDAPSLGNGGFMAWFVAALEHPLLKAVTLPMWPWAELVTATTPLRFTALLTLCLSIWYALYRLCAALRVDYRELSLETSADVARRLARLRRGATGAAGSSVQRSAAGWRVPWIFGRGPFGALAWRKVGTILRKARGTLLISGALTLVVTIGTLFLFDDVVPSSALVSSIAIAGFGTIYLCSGLRFDFREDLDRMDVVRSWPMAPWRVFLATILPEVVLVAALLSIAIVVRVAIAGHFPPAVAIVLMCLFPVALGWVSIDNSVFLLSPVRTTPGQEGLLQQAGRSLMLMLLRLISVGLAGGMVAAAAFVCWYGREWLGYGDRTAMLLAVAFGFAVLVAECALLIHIGGRLLARFDVARDR